MEKSLFSKTVPIVSLSRLTLRCNWMFLDGLEFVYLYLQTLSNHFIYIYIPDLVLTRCMFLFLCPLLFLIIELMIGWLSNWIGAHFPSPPACCYLQAYPWGLFVNAALLGQWGYVNIRNIAGVLNDIVSQTATMLWSLSTGRTVTTRPWVTVTTGDTWNNSLSLCSFLWNQTCRKTETKAINSSEDQGCFQMHRLVRDRSTV